MPASPPLRPPPKRPGAVVAGLSTGFVPDEGEEGSATASAGRASGAAEGGPTDDGAAITDTAGAMVDGSAAVGRGGVASGGGGAGGGSAGSSTGRSSGIASATNTAIDPASATGVGGAVTRMLSNTIPSSPVTTIAPVPNARACTGWR